MTPSFLQSGLPVRKIRKKAKVDTSKFMTPYLAHSQKMLDQYSHVRKHLKNISFYFNISRSKINERIKNSLTPTEQV